MINRTLIRIKVLQIVYSYYHNGGKDLNIAEKEFLRSLEKSYDLYISLLLIVVEVTDYHRRDIEDRKQRLNPTEEDLNPDTRFIDNRFAAQLAKNKKLNRYATEHSLSWKDDEGFLKMILDTILSSDIYSEYIKNENDCYATDKSFWRAVFKYLICGNEIIDEHLEDKCIYWNDDIDVVETFVLKTIKRFKENFDEQLGMDNPVLSMYTENESRMFAIQLFRRTLLKGDELRERINRHLNNWETERVPAMDMIIMQVALAEILTFPAIPLCITLNEYIDSSKYYSTSKSGVFINGVLNSIISELKAEKLLFKD